MIHKQSRRSFLGQCAKCGGACWALLALGRISRARESVSAQAGRQEKPIDLAALAYCGIPQAYCETRCELFKATRENDVKLKRAVYDKWGMKKKFGVDFDADKIFCHGCKPGDKPLKVGMAECEVRTCPISHGLESCVQCGGLASCDKAFWQEWPVAYAQIKQLQVRYKGQPGAKIVDIKAK
ncbi:MAG TPA: DUF3795 domain-containing protein [Candidatus Aminicenantes bacterium]|nr:DUF3795 domain-containing protein [Candidatus Aminicenantes bacterium]HRY64399.1 DUF3795 domain-containing protein [Candidatus Aminicenantes bacterium]HRZ71312.1 DUF3795 domain-containing protein [Candidatus Aminicenantes bacterium]